MNIEIMSRKLVKPSTPTPPHLQSHKLLVFDQLAPPSYVTIILYYSPSGNAAAGSTKNDAERCIELEKSLSKALTKFYPLAGRIVKDHLLVDCNDQGADYLEAQVNGELDEFLTRGPEIELLDQLVPWDIGSADSITSPLLAIQINNFGCGGLAIGVRVSHKLADASSITTFINEWATLNRTGNNGAIVPNLDLASLFPTRALGYDPPTAPNMGVKIFTRKFVFIGPAILALKDKARKGQYQPTRVMVVTAVIWKALINIARAKHGHPKVSLLVHLMNLRQNTGLCFSENSFGNIYTYVTSQFSKDECKMELQDLVGKLGDASQVARDIIKNLGEHDDISSTVIDQNREVYNKIQVEHELDINCFTSWCRFPMYEADFGWGKPTWISAASLPYQIVVLIDTKCGDGIEAWVGLNEEDMVELEQDPDILAFTS